MSERRSTTPPAIRDHLSGVTPEIPVRIVPAGPGTRETRKTRRPVVLRTPRLVLRPLEPDDADEFIRVVRASRLHLDRFSPLHGEGESDEALFERQLKLTRQTEANGSGFRRVGVLDDGRIAGAFNLNAIARGLEMKADVNTWIASESLRLGLASEGLTALLDHAFRDLPKGLGLHMVEAGIRRDNEASIALFTKLGFRRLGDERSHLRTGSQWVLHDIYERRIDLSSSES